MTSFGSGFAAGTTGYCLFDQQGNASEVVVSGSVHVRSGYNAWGSVNHQYPIPTNSDSYLKFGFNARWGYVTDASTGLNYCQNRYYDPVTGRFLTRDPIGYDGGANLYGYCGGNPVLNADPMGLYLDSIRANPVTAAWVFEETTGLEVLHSVFRVFRTVTDVIQLIQSLCGDAEKDAPNAEQTEPVAESERIHPRSKVRIDNEGNPIFDSDADVTITPTGTRRGDRDAANREAGLDETPTGKHWHHHQDAGRMQLVDAIEHILTGQTGGWSKWGKNAGAKQMLP